MSTHWEERARASRPRVPAEVIRLGDAAHHDLADDQDLQYERGERRLERQANAAEDLRDREEQRHHSEGWFAANLAWYYRSQEAKHRRYEAETTYLTRYWTARIVGRWIALGSSVYGVIHVGEIIRGIAQVVSSL